MLVQRVSLGTESQSASYIIPRRVRLMRTHLCAIVAAAVLLTAMTSAAQPMKPGPIGPGSSAIGGRVVDAQSGEALAGVLIHLTAARVLSFSETRTNADGQYEFAGIADGEYTVTAISTTHARSCHGALDTYQVRCGIMGVVRDQRLAGIDFLLQRGATVRGRVIDHDGHAVARALVRMELMTAAQNQASTASDGSFALTNISSGENRLVVEPFTPAELPRAPTVRYPTDGSVIYFTSGGLVDEVVITLPRIVAGAITVHASSATALDGVVAIVTSATPRLARRIELSSGGVGQTRGLREGRYYVFARAQTIEGPVAAYEVVERLEDDVDVSLSLQPTGRITGRIVAERGGIPPVEGVRVEATWIHDGDIIEPLARDEAAPGADGYFRIDGLFGTRVLRLSGLSQEWRVQSVMHKRADITNGVDVPSGATVDVTIVVARR